MNTIKRILNFSLLPREVTVAKRIVAATLLPIMVFYMTSLNFLVAGMMTAKADETAATTLVTAEPAPAASEAPKDAPKVEAPKVETPAAPTLAPENPKAETPAVVTPPVIVETSVAPIVAPIPETPKVETSASNVPIEPTSDNFNITSSVLPTTPTVDALGESSTEKLAWVTDGKKSTTNIPVALNTTYVAPQNDQVTVTFTKLPENAGKLSIEEITLTPEQVASLHALSNKAYDITSDMADGTFAYTMTLPKPKDQKNVQIKFAEDVAGLESADTVPSADVTTKTDSVSAKLDHFTIYTVTSFDHTLTYTFDEAVHLVTEDGSATIAKAEIAGKLSVYKYDSYAAYSGGAEPYKATDVSITGATFETGTEAGKVLSITYTGTLENTVKYVVDAWGYRIVNEAGVKVAAGSSDNQIILGDTVPPTTIADTVYDGSAKTITYTFSEPVRFKSEDTGAISAVDASKLAIYLYDAGSGNYGPDKVTGTNITNASFAGNVLTLTFTGNLVNQTDTNYIVDAFGYDIVDLAGNKLTRDSNQIFNVVGDTTAPAESSVVLDQTAKKVTTTFSEPVQLKNGSVITAYGDVTKNDLGIYKLTGTMTWENAAVGGVEVSAVHFSDATHLTVTYTGTLPVGIYIVDTFGADVTDLAGNKLTDAGALTFEVTDATLPAESSVVLDQTAKKVTTTFSEVVHLVNDDYSAHPTLTKDDLGIYTYTAGSWHNVDVVSISAVTLVDKVLTVTYTGTLPIGTYIIDTYGTKVVDASGNEMVDAGALTFDATGVIDTPAIAGVTAPVTDATPTSTIMATDLYTATISWSGAPVTFHPGTAYTATITITPKAGYTLTGVTSNYFTVADAIATNSANSGVISAVFPTTATKQLTIADPSSLTLSKTYDGTTTAAVTAGALSGVVSGDTVTVSAVATYNSKDFGTGKTITVEYTLSGNDAAKYIKPVNYTIATGIITQATSTTEVTCPTDSQTYTGSAITPCTVSVTGVGGLSLTPDPTYADNVNVGIATASYTYAGDTNHTGSSDSTTFSIGQTEPDEDGNVILDNGNPQVVLTNGEQAVVVEIAVGTANPTIDVSAFVAGDGTGTLPEITINSDVANVTIPDGTVINGPAGWDGIISAPTSGTPSGGNAPAGFAVGDTVITLGSPDGTITFDTPVVITLPGVTGAVGYRPAGSSQWTEITNVCTGTYESPTGAPAGGECAINNGTDTKILTYHFTSFGSLLDTLAPDGVKNLGAKYRPDTKDVKLSWDAKDKTIEKVYVYRGTNKNFVKDNDSRVSKQKRQDESFTDSDVEIGKTYFYKIVTEDAAGNQSGAKVIKITIPTNGKAAVGVLQGTESASKDNATSGNDNGNAINTANASNDSGSGAVLGETVGSGNQAGFWSSNWKWILVVIVAGAGILVWRKRKQGSGNITK